MVSFRFGTPPPPLTQASTAPSSGRSSSTPPSTTRGVEMTATSMGTTTTTTVLSKTADNIINTPAGVVHVRPYRSSSNAQLKAVLSFEPRVSSLDRTNVRSQTDEFRGFFVLFWIGLALLFLRTSLQSWEQNRTLLSWTFGRLITRDAVVLAFADGLMSLSMLLCVPFVKGLQHRWYRYYWTGVIIQHLFQTSYLAVAVWWGYVRQWYWVQSGFLVLHALANLMKMHSYMAHNGMLSQVYFRLKRERAALDQLVDSLPGGREHALEEAAARKAQLEAQEAENGPTPVGTPGHSRRGSIVDGVAPLVGGTTYQNPIAAAGRDLAMATATSTHHKHGHTEILSEAVDLRRRSITRLTRKKSKPAIESLPEPAKDLPQGTSLEPLASAHPHEAAPPSALAWSPNEEIALLARNIDAMEAELQSNGAKKVKWPQNVTYRHFVEFMFFPTLVYQLEYPRTNIRRPLVVAEKIAATFGTFSLIYLITEHYIMPFLPQKGDWLFRSYINLALPMMVNYLLIFYIIFECVCTGFAELSYFADREFYQDWWNSTTWDQFSRKWNKPVHTFLLRHVYASTMDGLQLSRTSATFVTFLLSALCHEMVMAVVTKKIRPYLFMMQMAQLPMIWLGRMPIIRRNKTVGNIVFWAGLMLGFPLLAVGYLLY